MPRKALLAAASMFYQGWGRLSASFEERSVYMCVRVFFFNLLTYFDVQKLSCKVWHVIMRYSAWLLIRFWVSYPEDLFAQCSSFIVII
jgi:hypothetical protein